jgi:hypothetical protein
VTEIPYPEQDDTDWSRTAVARRSDLFGIGCGHADHPLALGGVCHPWGGVIADYLHETGLLRIKCMVCLKPITQVLVAE